MIIGFHVEGLYTEAEVTIQSQTVSVHHFSVDGQEIESLPALVGGLHRELVRRGIVHNRIMAKRSVLSAKDTPLGQFSMN